MSPRLLALQDTGVSARLGYAVHTAVALSGSEIFEVSLEVCEHFIFTVSQFYRISFILCQNIF